MVANDFISQGDAIPYPDRADYADRSEHSEAMLAYRAARREVDKAFGVALADAYLESIAESRRQAIGEQIFPLAWENGHESGYHQVENHYIDFAEVAVKIYAVATS